MDDQQILDLYYTRQETAIGETGKKYGLYLNKIAYNILKSSRDAEEIVNDTYLGAWKAIPPAKPYSLRHFLSRITRNLSFNRLEQLLAKRRCRDAEIFLSELDECIPTTQSAEDAWEASEIGNSLNRFLHNLDTNTRGIFVARYYYVFSIREIALRFSLSERQIKYILSRTRTQLRTFFEKEGIYL